MTLSKKISFQLILVAITIFIIQLFLFFNFQVDDSYISFRYSKNLIKYGVWNWNKLGENVEAYTSLTYTLLGIIPHYLNINPILFFKILGICFSIIPVYYLKKNNSSTDFLIALFFVIANPLFYIHSFSGLETPLFMLLIFLLFYYLNNKEIKENKVIYLILFLLPLTRPEGGLFSLSIILMSFYKKDFNLKWTIILILSSLSYFIIRYNYFGYFFPNTFYVKSITSVDKSFYDIIRSNIISLEYYVVLIVSFFLFKSKYIRILIINSLIILIYYNYSNLMMNYNERFNFQIVFPLLIFLLYNIKNKKIFTSIIVLNLLILSGSIKSKSVYLSGINMNLEESHGLLGKSLNEFKDQGLILAIGDAGMVPYFSEWETIDYIGLANNQIAQNGLTLKYIEEKSPDLIVLYSLSDKPSDLFHESKDVFLKFFKINNNYEKIASVRNKNDFYLLCYLKKDIKCFQKIKSKIKQVENQTLTY